MFVYEDPEDRVSECLRPFGFWEGHETLAICKSVKRGQVALDLGANIGYHTLLLAKMVGPEGRVAAFEPESENVRLIRANLALNGLSNVDVIPAAVTDRSGLAVLSQTALRHGEGLLASDDPGFTRSPIVPALTLDDLKEVGIDRVDFIKIDIEGAELDALQGGLGLIARTSGHLQMFVEFNAQLYAGKARRLGIDTPNHLRSMFSASYCDPTVGKFHPLEVATEDFVAMIESGKGKNPDGSLWTPDAHYSDIWLTPRA